MENINFSADMVGIQTLAQQGIIGDEESVLSAGCSFEDMILQMIANNLTINNVEGIKTVIDGISEKNTEGNTDSKELIMNAIMSGMVAPEIVACDFSMENTEENVSEEITEPITDMRSEVRNLPLNELNEVHTETADTSKVFDLFSPVQKFVKCATSEKTDDNLVQINEVKPEENVKLQYESDVHIVRGQKDEDFQPTVFSEKSDFATVKSENNSNVIMSEKDSEETFISTADMLQLRMGNKINFSNSSVAFKVAQPAVDIRSKSAVKDIADQILMRFNEREFEIELYPKSLGKIAISLVLENGLVRVAMSGDNEKVNAFLASQSANIQNIVEKNTQYHAVVKVDDSQNQYQQQRDTSQQGAPDEQKQREQEHMKQMYRQNIEHTDDFLSMLKLV